MTSFYAFTSVFVCLDGWKRYVNDDRLRVHGDKNMRLPAFAFTIVFVWTGPEKSICRKLIVNSQVNINKKGSLSKHDGDGSENVIWKCNFAFLQSIFKRDLKQPRRRRQQKPHKFAYLTMENTIFARFARAYFIFWHFEDVLVLSTTWNDLFCSCVSIWWQMFNFVFFCPKHWFQFNSRMVRTHFSSIMTLNNWKIIAETRVKLHLQMTFLLPSMSCLLKLPYIS